MKKTYIIVRARTISIIIIISTRQGLLKGLGWRWRRKTTKTRLVASDATDSSVHVTHLIRQMVKTTTKISTYVLKLLHDVSEKDICLKGGRRSRCKGGLRGRCCRGWIHHLHIWSLHSKLRCTLLDRLLAYGTHDMEERRRRNSGMHVC